MLELLAFANEEETGMATIFGTALEQVGKLNDKLDAASAKNAGQISSNEEVNCNRPPRMCCSARRMSTRHRRSPC